MAKTAVLHAADYTLAGVANSKAEVANLVGETPDAFVLITKKTFVASEDYPTFESLVDTGEIPTAQAEGTEDTGATKAPRASSIPLEGAYAVVKPVPPVAEDHPRKAFIEAITSNTTCEAALAACPDKVARAKNGFFTFSTEFRYLLARGNVVLNSSSQ